MSVRSLNRPRSGVSASGVESKGSCPTGPARRPPRRGVEVAEDDDPQRRGGTAEQLCGLRDLDRGIESLEMRVDDANGPTADRQSAQPIRVDPDRSAEKRGQLH